MDELEKDVAFFKRASLVLLAFAILIVGYDIYKLVAGKPGAISFLPIPLAAIAALLWWGKRYFEKLSAEQQQRALRGAEQRSFLKHTTRNVS